MKLIVRKREYKDVETNIELPVYLYFQDESCNDEYVKLTETEKITIKYNYNAFTISVDPDYYMEDINVERHLTDKADFDEAYMNAITQLKKSIS